MGLRSPQQLDKAQKKSVNPNQAKVEPFQDESLSNAVKQFSSSYSQEYQDAYAKNKVLARKQAIAKTNINNMVDRVSKTAESLLGGLEGDNVIGKGGEIFSNTQKDYQELAKNIPEEYRFDFNKAVEAANTAFNSKYMVKAYSEESKRLDAQASSNIKTKMDEVANTISVINGPNSDASGKEFVSFESKIAELDTRVEEGFLAKGYDLDLRAKELLQEKVQVRSKSLLQGIETFASSRRTDMLQMAQKAFDTYGNNPMFMTSADREAAFKALKAGQESNDGELAYQIANKAVSDADLRNGKIDDVIKSINAAVGALPSPSTDVTSKAIGLGRALYESKKQALAEREVDRYAGIAEKVQGGDLAGAINILQEIKDPKTFNDSLDFMNKYNTGNYFTVPEVLRQIEKDYRNNPENFDQYQLGNKERLLSREDREMVQRWKNDAAKKKSDSRYNVFTGRHEADAVNKALQFTLSYAERRGRVLVPFEREKMRRNLQREYWVTRDENPNEFNPSIIERKFLEKAEKSLFIEKDKQYFGITPPDWFPIIGGEKELLPNPDFGLPNIPISEDTIKRYQQVRPDMSRDDVIRAIRRAEQKKRQNTGK